MPYCTQSDLTTRFGQNELIQLTDRSNAGVIDTTVLNTAIVDADALINEKLVAYLPLTTIPARLPRCACDITRYYLYGNSIPEPVQQRYDEAVKFLTDTANSLASLGADATGTAVPDTSNEIDFIAGNTILSGDLAGY